MVRKIEAFTDEERAALHSVAEMLRDKDDRDQLRRLIHDGTTLREIILAYRTQRRLVAGLKATAGLIVLLGGAVAALKSLGLWPK